MPLNSQRFMKAHFFLDRDNIGCPLNPTYFNLLKMVWLLITINRQKKSVSDPYLFQDCTGPV